MKLLIFFIICLFSLVFYLKNLTKQLNQVNLNLDCIEEIDDILLNNVIDIKLNTDLSVNKKLAEIASHNCLINHDYVFTFKSYSDLLNNVQDQLNSFKKNEFEKINNL